MKKSLAFLIVICLLMILAGCKNDSGSATAGVKQDSASGSTNG